MTDKILLVDDDTEHLEMLEDCCARIGCNTVSASGGEKAVEILKSDSFAIVISDIQMPVVDGIGVLGFAKEHAPETDVVLITGFSDKYSFTDVIKKGATDYLEKPFTKDILEAKIFRIFKERREIAKRKSIENILEKKSNELSTRVKELECLYNISQLLYTHDLPLGKLFDGVVHLLVKSLPSPQHTVARITYDNRCFQSINFRETALGYRKDIFCHGMMVGSLEIYCSKEHPTVPGRSLLEEKSSLISSITERLGKIIARYRAEEQLSVLNEQLEEKVMVRTEALNKALQDKNKAQSELYAIFNSNPDGIITVDSRMIVMHKNNVHMSSLKIEEGEPFRSLGTHLQKECFKILNSTLLDQKGVKDYRVEYEGLSGAHRVKLLNTSLLKNEEQQICGAVLNLHDITKLALLESELSERRGFRKIIGVSEQVQNVYTLIRQVASVDTTVLITGETGTGKELVVDTLHSSGDLANKPLVKVNCAGLPENLLESELFGHVKGAFTGAHIDRIGRIQAAEGGILFLDEIGEISHRVQLRLLRFLEQKEYERVGDSKTIIANVRVVAATNANLEQLVKEKKFREDLYYRLRVFCINLPPLRERGLDISLLTKHFIELCNKRFNKEVKGLSQAVSTLFSNYSWPGNIRELKHAIEHACLLCNQDYLLSEHLPNGLWSNDENKKNFMKTSLRSIKKEEFLAALEKTDWNKAKAARMLDISRSTLYTKLQELNISQ
nr:sigma 54-interacting transcriptional regulator [Desulfobulbaceae bacterium]